MAVLGDTKAVSLTLLDGVLGNLNPKTTNVYDLGTSSLKWNNIYGTLKGNADSATNVTGTVAIANGGTGKTTANDAINALLNGLPTWSANPIDTTYFIRQDTGGSATYGKVPFSTLYSYIKSKAEGSWSINITGTAANVTGTVAVANGGTGATDAAGARTNLGLGTIATAATGDYVLKSGDTMTGNLGILMGDTDKHIIFDYDGDGSAGASWRIAALGSGSADTNYFTIQSGTSTTSATSWNNVIRLGLNTFDAGFGGNVYPLTDNTKTLGTSSLKWKNVYATTFNGALSGNATSATGFASAKTIALTGDITGSATGGDGSNDWNIATTIGNSKVTNAMLAGSIANGKLANSSVSIAGNSVSLGGSLTADTLRTSLGLSNAMHFIGVTSTTLSDGATTTTLTAKSSGSLTKTTGFVAGDVVIDTNSAYEYVWTGSAWERLGPDGSYKVTQTAYTDSTGTSESTTATRFVYSVSQDANGVVSVKTRPLPTYNNYSLPLAASGTRGGIQIGYSESGKNYAVKLSSEKAYVSVPWTDTLNTAGSTDTSSKIFLVGATSLASSAQTYSDNLVYATNGQLDANKVRVAEAVSLVYDSTTQALNFVFS